MAYWWGDTHVVLPLSSPLPSVSTGLGCHDPYIFVLATGTTS